MAEVPLKKETEYEDVVIVVEEEQTVSLARTEKLPLMRLREFTEM